MSIPALTINLKNTVITGTIGGWFNINQQNQNTVINYLVLNLYDSTLNLYIYGGDFLSSICNVTYNMINSKINYITIPNQSGVARFSWNNHYIFNIDKYSSFELIDNSGVDWCYGSGTNDNSPIATFGRKYIKNFPSNISLTYNSYLNNITNNSFSYQVNNISQPVTNPGGSSTRLTVGGLKNYSAPLNWKK